MTTSKQGLRESPSSHHHYIGSITMSLSTRLFFSSHATMSSSPPPTPLSSSLRASTDSQPTISDEVDEYNDNDGYYEPNEGNVHGGSFYSQNGHNQSQSSSQRSSIDGSSSLNGSLIVNGSQLNSSSLNGSQLLNSKGEPLSVTDIVEDTYYRRHPYRERCPNCSKEFETPASFHVHHPCFERSEFFLKNQGQDDPNGMHYLCKFCRRTFFERHLLKQHIRYHLSERPFECNFCGHRFVCRPEVVAHVSSFHLKLKPFVCSEPGCGKKYAEKFSLERHMDKNHGGKAFYKCKVCGEEFHWNSKWNKHKKTHPDYPEETKETPVVEGNPLVCQFPGCGKRYSQKFMVGLHYEAVHLGKPRYKCDVCDKTFMFGQYLRDHKKRVGHLTENDRDLTDKAENDSVVYMDGEENECLSPGDRPEEKFHQEDSGLSTPLDLSQQNHYSNNREEQVSLDLLRQQLLESHPSLVDRVAEYIPSNSTYHHHRHHQPPQAVSVISLAQQQQNHRHHQLVQQNSYASHSSERDPYEPSNFLEVVLVEGEENRHEEDHANGHNAQSPKLEMQPEIIENITEEKESSVCSECGGRFLSQVLFARHIRDHREDLIVYSDARWNPLPHSSNQESACESPSCELSSLSPPPSSTETPSPVADQPMQDVEEDQPSANSMLQEETHEEDASLLAEKESFLRSMSLSATKELPHPPPLRRASTDTCSFPSTKVGSERRQSADTDILLRQPAKRRRLNSDVIPMPSSPSSSSSPPSTRVINKSEMTTTNNNSSSTSYNSPRRTSLRVITRGGVYK